MAGQVQRIQPHLVLLDLTLPRESGFNICSAIRAVSGLPVIVVTSSDTEMDELNSLLLGADAFVTKPYNTADPSGKDRCTIAPGLSCPPGCRALLPGGGTSSGKRDAGISGPYCGIDQDGGTDSCTVCFVGQARSAHEPRSLTSYGTVSFMWMIMLSASISAVSEKNCVRSGCMILSKQNTGRGI